MFARIGMSAAVKQKVVTVPSNAVLTEGERTFVLIEESPGRFIRRQVKTGPDVEGNTVVQEGLLPNDRVVTGGVLLLSSAENGKQ